jgi:PAS domain S-box-containing protein
MALLISAAVICPPHSGPWNARIDILLFLSCLTIASLFIMSLLDRREGIRDLSGLTEERFREIFDLLAVGVAQVDSTTGRFIRVNRQYCEIVGFTRDQLASTSFMAITHPEDLPADLEHLERLKRGLIRSFSLEKRYLRRNGSVVWIHLTVSPMWAPGEPPTSHLAVVEDITKRRQAEATLEESEARFHAIFEDSPIAIWEEDFSEVQARFHELRQSGVTDIRTYLCENPNEVRDLAAKVRVIGINQVSVRMLGAESKDQVCRGLPHFFTPQSQDAFREELAVLSEGGTRFSGEVALVDVQGKPVVVELTLAVQPGHQKTLSRVLVSLVDITDRKRAEEALRQLSRKDEEALRVAQMGHWEFDISSGLFTFNDVYYLLHGTAAMEVGGYQMTAGDFARRFVHPEDAHMVEEHIQGAIAGGTTDFKLQGQVRILRVDGEVRIVNVWFRVEKDAQGAAIKLHGINQDITERVRADEALRARNRYIETILENSPIGFAVNTIRDGKTVFVASKFAEIYGVPPSRATSVEEFFEMVYPDPVFREEIRARIMADMASGDPGRMHWENIPVTTAGGEKKFVTATNIPLPEQDLMVSTVQDVTAQHRAEEARRESEYRFRSLVEQAGDSFELYDAEGRLVDVNTAACRQLGYSKDEMLSLGIQDIDPLISHETYAARFQGPAGKPPVTFESTRRRKDGTTFPVEVTVSMIRHGETLWGVVLARDITDRRRAQQEQQRLQAQLIQAQRIEAIGQLAGGVAHDFNNILTSILMSIGLLQEHPKLPAEVRGGLKDLEGEAMRAADLTRQLLMFSRRQVLQTKVFDLNSLVGNLLKMLRRLIGEQIMLEFKGTPGEIWLEADAGMIEQVIVNLVVNARDAMPKSGRITLTTRRLVFDQTYTEFNPEAHPGLFACLEVTDTGCGMDASTRERIFEPFFTTKEVHKGTGLGLSTVHGIVKQHQGWVEVESTPGHGSSLRVYLPARREAPVMPAGIAIEGNTTPPGNETILLVEDAEGVRRVTASILRRLGYHVIEAANGQEALMLWPQVRQKVALLLTDMVMPGEVNGQELAVRLRRDKPSLKCLLVSGYSHDLVQRGLSPQQEIVFLPKPLDPTTLAAKIRSCLDS